MTAQIHIDHANFTEQYVSKYIALADTKAMWTFTVAAAALLYITGKLNFSNFNFKNSVEILGLGILTVIIILLMTGCFMAYRSIQPNTKSSASDNLIFFGSIATYESAENYRTAVLNTSEIDILEKRLSHCYDLAKVCGTKFHFLKIAQRFTFLGILGLSLLTAFTLF